MNNLKKFIQLLIVLLILLAVSCKEKNQDLESKGRELSEKELITLVENSKRYSAIKKSGYMVIKDKGNDLFWNSSFSGTKMNHDEAVKFCENSKSGGYKDWRLPEIEELDSLIDRGMFKPASDFPGITTEIVWSSSASNIRKDNFKRISFYDGTIYGARKDEKHHAFCVRSEKEQKVETDPDRFTKTDEGIYSDKKTGLDWVDISAEKNVWAKAKLRCIGLKKGGYSDWKLPNINELGTIIDHKGASPASNLPGIEPKPYWSSSVSAKDKRKAWSVYFNSGIIVEKVRRNKQKFLCVRGRYEENSQPEKQGKPIEEKLKLLFVNDGESERFQTDINKEIEAGSLKKFSATIGKILKEENITSQELGVLVYSGSLFYMDKVNSFIYPRLNKCKKSENWIVNFIHSFYHFYTWDDKKALDSLNKSIEQYKQTKTSGKFLEFTNELKQFLEHSIKNPDMRNVVVGKVKLKNPENCYFYEYNPGKPETTEWTGKCKNGLADGKGKFIYSGGGYEKGVAKDGKILGDAEIYTSGLLLKVNVKEDGTAYGTQSKKGAVQYRGSFKNLFFHGKGTELGSDFAVKATYFKGKPLPTKNAELTCIKKTGMHPGFLTIIRHYPIKNKKFTSTVSCKNRKKVYTRTLSKIAKLRKVFEKRFGTSDDQICDIFEDIGDSI